MTAPPGLADELLPTTRQGVEITLVHHLACPLVDQVRATICDALLAGDIQASITEVSVIEVQGGLASPTVLINGLEVNRGAPVPTAPACRLELPTAAELLAALSAPRAQGRRA
ncbi:MAG: hypothetical protein ACRDY2_09435 [Acidimicrobiales bacterium]